jgi:hypothetical protein
MINNFICSSYSPKSPGNREMPKHPTSPFFSSPFCCSAVLLFCGFCDASVKEFSAQVPDIFAYLFVQFSYIMTK